MKQLILTALIATTLAACATNPDKIAGAYIPPSEYAGESCSHLRVAYSMNESKARDLYSGMKTKSRVNATAGVVGAVLFWPALFFMKGKDAEADARMAELKGRKVAIEKAMNKEGC